MDAPRDWSELYDLSREEFDELSTDMDVYWPDWEFEMLPDGDDGSEVDADIYSPSGRLQIVGHILGFTPLTTWPHTQNDDMPGALDATGSERVHSGQVVDNQSGELRPAVERIHGPRPKRTGAPPTLRKRPVNQYTTRPVLGTNAG